MAPSIPCREISKFQLPLMYFNIKAVVLVYVPRLSETQLLMP